MIPMKASRLVPFSSTVIWHSQRDVSLHIPINFVNQPGISVTAACFSHQQYISTAAARCISNLLAIGIRRLELDVYWDVSRRVWSLCPVESGGDKSSQNVTSSLPAQTVAMSTASLASGQLTGALARATSAIDLKYGAVVNRQDTSLKVFSRSSSASSSSTTTTTLSMIANSTSMSLPLPTYQSGSYSCESSTSLELFVDVLSGYLSRTETNLNATIMTLILNVHAAAPQSASPTSASEPQSDDLPRDGELLSSILSTNMSIYTYTPNELDAQRVTLNSSGSWYSDSAYYETINNASPDGWPSESFVELRKAERLLVGFGRVDPQMLQYNFTGDNSVIFPSGYLQANPAVTLSSVAVDAGCLYQQGQFDVQNVNSSWAVAPLQANQISAAQQLIDCGISPSLNQSLDNITADQSWAPYRDYVLSTDWAWGAGEPRNATDDESDAGLLIKCAVLNATSGRMQVADCGSSHRAGCRAAHQPYVWSFSDSEASYTDVSLDCDGDASFGVPRTALEKTYLLAAWRSRLATRDDDNDQLLWVNFNSLDVSNCWVIGQNTTCPYTTNHSTAERKITVPTTAAVIVFVVALMTVLTKCAKQRSSKRRRRLRGDDNGDYEGVPS